jgi:hypothetical protein
MEQQINLWKDESQFDSLDSEERAKTKAMRHLYKLARRLSESGKSAHDIFAALRFESACVGVPLPLSTVEGWLRRRNPFWDSSAEA